MAVKIQESEAAQASPASETQPDLFGKPVESEKQAAIDELLILGPEIETLEFRNGLTVTIAPLKMKQIRQLLSMGESLFPAIEGLATEYALKGEVSIRHLGNLAGDDFFKIIALASNLTVDQIDELDPDEFVRVVGKVVVVNMDFFGRTLPGVVQGVGVGVQRTMGAFGDGRTQSKSS